MRSVSRTALVTVPALLLVSGVSAECCRVVKTDAELPPTTVRVCESSASGECDALLFAGTLALGESQDVCASGDTIVYQELDSSTQVFMEPVEARCEGGDVEL